MVLFEDCVSLSGFGEDMNDHSCAHRDSFCWFPHKEDELCYSVSSRNRFWALFVLECSSMKRMWFESLCAMLAFLSALTMGGLILLYMGESPAVVYGLLLKGALGSAEQINMTLATTAPYLLCGLSLAIAFQAGLFNIGAEGQLFAGAMVGALLGRWLEIPFLAPWIVLLVSVGAGALWAWIPAFLKVRFGVHEVINTIMLNYIMFSLCAFLVRQPAIRVNRSVPRTVDVSNHAQMGGLHIFGLQWDVGLLVGIVLAFVLLHVLRRTGIGFEIRVTGIQPDAAKTAGIDPHKITIWTFMLSGAIAGLAGGFHVISPQHPHFEMGLSPGWGFWGIALALLARNHPVGIVFSACLFGILETGGGVLDTSLGIPRELIQILEALIILMVSSRLFVRLLDPERRFGHV
ncbi:MAG: hypothetical protein CL920_39610 [Deltaproteobacteria bacterium]|nr:hypothetical protein [Deltaproteobacteria bacterium]MBU54843.1 hypothetical protein [Deltaproteobacteria bacterium]